MTLNEAIPILARKIAIDFEFPEHFERWERMPWPTKVLTWSSAASLVGFFCFVLPLLREEGRNTYRYYMSGLKIYVDLLCGRRTNMTQLMIALKEAHNRGMFQDWPSGVFDEPVQRDSSESD